MARVDGHPLHAGADRNLTRVILTQRRPGHPLHAGADRNFDDEIVEMAVADVTRFTRVRIETTPRGRRSCPFRSPASRGCGSKPGGDQHLDEVGVVTRFTRVRIETLQVDNLLVWPASPASRGCGSKHELPPGPSPAGGSPASRGCGSKPNPPFAHVELVASPASRGCGSKRRHRPWREYG